MVDCRPKMWENEVLVDLYKLSNFHKDFCKIYKNFTFPSVELVQVRHAHSPNYNYLPTS